MISKCSDSERNLSVMGLPDWLSPNISSLRSCKSRSASSKPSSVLATALIRSPALILPAAGWQAAQAGMLAPADASAQLVQLTDAEPVSVHHHHHRRVRHVDADFDNGGAHQDIDLPA